MARGCQELSGEVPLDFARGKLSDPDRVGALGMTIARLQLLRHQKMPQMTEEGWRDSRGGGDLEGQGEEFSKRFLGPRPGRDSSE